MDGEYLVREIKIIYLLVNNIPFEIINTTGNIFPEFTNDYYSFTSGTGTVTFSKTCTIEILIVAGGGSGGYGTGGGGGGGGYIQTYQQVRDNTPYTITIGSGGNPINSRLNGENGGNSVFDTLIAIGGGGGGSNITDIRGQLSTGGSGGGQGIGRMSSGDTSITVSAGLGTSGQGNKGGNSTSNRYSAGGGGGGGEIGGDANIYGGGKGGNGYASSITGTTVYYAAGGAGGTSFYDPNTNGIGGIGGGGNGGSSIIERASGKDATGYGCGGGGTGNANNASNPSVYSGRGSHGIIIIKPIKS